MVQIVQNDYLGHISVLTMKPKCSRYQQYGQYLKVSCVFYPKYPSELVITYFENRIRMETYTGTP